MPPICIYAIVAYVVIDLLIIWSVVAMGSRCSREEEKLWEELNSRREN